jgi:hypothetical protein
MKYSIFKDGRFNVQRESSKMKREKIFLKNDIISHRLEQL